MTASGIILYGAPASGKDTITAALTSEAPEFKLYKRLKVGPGRTAGYRMTDAPTLEQLVISGEIIWENRRYNSRYAIDRTGLETLAASGTVPVVHAGQPGVIAAVQRALPNIKWTIIQLRCSRESAHSRIVRRATGDVEARLDAWDSTPVLVNADATIDTDTTAPDDAARQISELVHRHD